MFDLTERSLRPEAVVGAAGISAEPISTIRASRSLAVWLGLLTFTFSALLAYRWQSAVGSVTPGRIGLVSMFLLLLRSMSRARLSGRGKMWLGAQGFLVSVVAIGVMYTSEVSLGFTSLLEHFEAAGLFLSFFVLVRRRPNLSRRVSAMLPLYAYLPSGALAIYQAVQLATGQTPTIPFVEFANLDASTVNAARTAFGTGLDVYGIDRIAAATGDPPTFGVLSALVVVYFLWARKVVPQLPRAASVIIVFVGLIGVFLSQSVSALIVLAIGAAGQWISSRNWAARRRRVPVANRRVPLWPVWVCLRLLLVVGVIYTEAVRWITSRRGQRVQPLPASLANRKVPPWPALICLGLLVVVGVMYAQTSQPIFDKQTLQRFLDSAITRFAAFAAGNGTTSNHMALIGGGWDIFTEHPILGVGTGAGSAAYFGQPVPFSSFHNVVVLRLAENGVLGFSAVLLMWATLARYVPIPLMLASLASWSLYLDWDRLPFMWCVLGVAAALNVSRNMVDAINRRRQPSRFAQAGHIADTA